LENVKVLEARQSLLDLLGGTQTKHILDRMNAKKIEALHESGVSNGSLLQSKTLLPRPSVIDIGENDAQKPNFLLHDYCKNPSASRSSQKIDPRSYIEKTLALPGVNVNSRDARGYTPLLYACTTTTPNNRDEIIKILLEKGADINICTLEGLRPYQAYESQKKDISCCSPYFFLLEHFTLLSQKEISLENSVVIQDTVDIVCQYFSVAKSSYRSKIWDLLSFTDNRLALLKENERVLTAQQLIRARLIKENPRLQSHPSSLTHAQSEEPIFDFKHHVRKPLLQQVSQPPLPQARAPQPPMVSSVHPPDMADFVQNILL
jgi:hypothetical protein